MGGSGSAGRPEQHFGLQRRLGRGLICVCRLRVDLVLDSGATAGGQKAPEAGGSPVWELPRSARARTPWGGWGTVSLSWEQFLSQVTLPAPSPERRS